MPQPPLVRIYVPDSQGGSYYSAWLSWQLLQGRWSLADFAWMSRS